MSENPMAIGAMPSNKGAVGHYRIIQPLAQITDSIAAIKDVNMPSPLWESQAHKFDVFVYQYPQSSAELDHISFMSSDPYTLTVVDIDDTVWNMDARQENYFYFGVKEVKMNGKWVYKDGQDGFDLNRNQERMQNLAACLAACDLVTVTTPKLKGTMEKNLKEAGKKAPKVEVLPNSVDLSTYYSDTEVTSPETRIIWQGGHGHRHDMAVVADDLKQILDDNPKVKLVIAGTSWKEIEERLGKEQLILKPEWTSFDAHPYRLKLLGGDIGICPLAEAPFNEAKSEIKYTEYSALGIPTVASDVVVYSSVIKDGKTGYLGNFKENLQKLIDSPKLRKELGSNARRWVEDNRDARKTFHQWEETYKKHLSLKKTPIIQ